MAVQQQGVPILVTEEDIRIMPNMVRWFNPTVLFKILKPVVISGIFGSYADRRLMQAALDQRPHSEHFEYSDIRNRLAKDLSGNVWVDFIADTGDGFASTYTVAWLQSQPRLEIGGHDTERGSLLLLGGDQVYPDATYPNYLNRFKKVFDWAFADNGDKEDNNHPLVYAIPGNHDWYDGLDLFLAFFCRSKPWKLGNWRTRQRRSYFAIRLTDKVWVWGIDIQLSENVDSPQAEYFREIASRMDEGSSIVMMTAVPGWYDPSHRGFNCLGYVEKIAHKANRALKIPLVLSGDVHHYARYVCEELGTQFITSGGGGAFLHPTHMLKKEVRASWGDAIGRERKITLARLQKDDAGSDEDACYPSTFKSIGLLAGLKRSPFTNWKFGAILGGLYAIAGLTALMWSLLETPAMAITNFVWLIWVLLFAVIFVRSADQSDWIRNGRIIFENPSSKEPKNLRNDVLKRKHWLLGFLHALVHIVAMTVCSAAIYYILVDKFGFLFWTTSFNLAFLFSITIVGGFAAGAIFACYLYLTCRFLGAHSNEALSAQSLDQYRGFLRLSISPNQIKIYPVGVDKVLQKQDWTPSKIATGSRVVPKVEEKIHRMIEKPIAVAVGGS